MTLTLHPSQHRAALLGERPHEGLLVLELGKLTAATASCVLLTRSSWDFVLRYSTPLGRPVR